MFRNHGLKKRDHVVTLGINSRLDVLNAEILKMRLKKLNKINKIRRNNVKIYRNNLNQRYVNITHDNHNEINSYVMFLVQVEKRDKLQKYLSKHNVQSLIYYGTPLHLHPATKSLGYKKGSFPNSEKLASKVLALPHHQYLTKKQILFVCEKINKFYS